jgi:hypothetical protein
MGGRGEKVCDDANSSSLRPGGGLIGFVGHRQATDFHTGADQKYVQTL